MLNRLTAGLVFILASHAALAQPGGMPGGGNGGAGGVEFDASYDPYQDNRIWFADQCVSFASQRVFGWYDGNLSWDLRLDAPIDEETGEAAGINATGQEFTLHCYSSHIVARDGLPSGWRFGFWAGALTGPSGSVVCYGLARYTDTELAILPWSRSVTRNLGGGSTSTGR